MQKKITNISHPSGYHWVGDGFRVTQYIPGYGKKMSDETSPFLMLDYNAPFHMEPRDDGHRPGVGYHPHRGFGTVTIVYSGEVEHQDTAGNGGIIGPDEVQWMTAGSGLLHNEFFTTEFSRNGGIAHFVQLWVNLAKEYKMTPPRYQALTKNNIPEAHFQGGKVRIIAGELKMKNESRHSEERRIQTSETLDPSYRQDDEIMVQKGIAKTYSPIELYDLLLDQGGEIALNFLSEFSLRVLVISGEIFSDNKTVSTGDMATFSLSGEMIRIHATKDARILVMAGLPLHDHVVNYGPFVMNTEEEITEAFRDFEAGKMGVIPEA